MPGMKIPEEKCYSFHLGGTNVPVGRNNYTRHRKTRDSFSFFVWKTMKIGKWQKNEKILI